MRWGGVGWGGERRGGAGCGVGSGRKGVNVKMTMGMRWGMGDAHRRDARWDGVWDARWDGVWDAMWDAVVGCDVGCGCGRDCGVERKTRMRIRQPALQNRRAPPPPRRRPETRATPPGRPEDLPSGSHPHPSRPGPERCWAQRNQPRGGGETAQGPRVFRVASQASHHDHIGSGYATSSKPAAAPMSDAVRSDPPLCMQRQHTAFTPRPIHTSDPAPKK